MLNSWNHPRDWPTHSAGLGGQEGERCRSGIGERLATGSSSINLPFGWTPMDLGLRSFAEAAGGGVCFWRFLRTWRHLKTFEDDLFKDALTVLWWSLWHSYMFWRVLDWLEQQKIKSEFFCWDPGRQQTMKRKHVNHHFHDTKVAELQRCEVSPQWLQRCELAWGEFAGVSWSDFRWVQLTVHQKFGICWKKMSVSN